MGLEVLTYSISIGLFLLCHFVRYTCRLKKEIDHFERGREENNTVELEQRKRLMSDRKLI